MQNAACYIRVSTDDQTEFSPDAQLRAIKNYAKNNDMIIIKEHIYADEGVSGRKAEKRPAFMKMISTAKAKPKPFDVILVHKFDRFARSREDSVVYKALLRKECDIKVVSITESIEDDKFSIILEAMLEAMAEYYSLNLSEEVLKGMTEKAEKGGLQTCASFGYKVVNNILIKNDTEAEIVKFIFESFASKTMNIMQITRYMNDLGIKTHRGNQFEQRTIRYILHNPVYIGKLRWTPSGRTRRNFDNPDTIIVEGKHEAIISMELWEQTQSLLKNHKEIYQKKQKPTTSKRHWSHGLIKCGNCGKTLVYSAKNSYQCNAYAKGTCKISHSITVNKIEDLILDQLKETFKNNLEININPKKNDNKKSSMLSMLNEQYTKLALKEQRIKTAYQDGIDTLEEYKANKKKLEDDKQFISSQLEELKSEQLKSNSERIIKKIDNVYSLLTDDSISMDMKYNASHFLINKVIFDKKNNLISIEYK